MAKIVKFDSEARSAMLRGVDVLANTVKVTLEESEELNAILNKNKTYIQHEILATTINVAKEVSSETIELSFDSLHTQVAMVKS